MVLVFDLTSLVYSLALRKGLFNSDVTFLREVAGTKEGTAISEIRKAQIFCNLDPQQKEKEKDKVNEMGGSIDLF